MGKKPGASPEELEFIFKCFLRGLTTTEVLAEMEDTEIPKRSPRFIRELRKHFDAARKVLEEHPGGYRQTTPPIHLTWKR
jgi:hypothetical protein